MSYKIDSVDTIRSTLTVTRKKWSTLKKKFDNGQLCAAELNFVDYLSEKDFVDDVARIERVEWCGESSGNSFHDGIFAKAIAATSGDADLIMYWEGGDSVGGVKIRNGKVREVNVRMELEDE